MYFSFGESNQQSILFLKKSRIQGCLIENIKVKISKSIDQSQLESAAY